MPHSILVRVENTHRVSDSHPEMFWHLEYWDSGATKPQVISLYQGALAGRPLVEVLNRLETRDNWRMVGHDGPNRYVLYKDP